jgi:TPR repeat protein
VTQCDLGDGPSCGSAAAAYESGKSGIEKDPAKAFEYAVKGCNIKDADSCDLVGGYKRSGKGTAKDVEGGVTLQTNACRVGSARACRDVGTYFASSSPPDWRLALAYAERACDGGCTPGCADAGKIYQLGNGVTKDSVKANSLFKRGCDGMKPHTGWDSNCSAYGANLQHGEGVAINATEAAGYYKRSCDVAGNAYACDSLGQLAQTGAAGYPADINVAAKYTGKACSAGMQAPCTQLANYLIEGKGVTADKPKALNLLRTACKKKHQPACDQLKKMGEATE